MAAYTKKRQSDQTMDFEMEDCASYESFCGSMNDSKKSRLSLFTTGESDSDSDDYNWEVTNTNSFDNNSGNIEWGDEDGDDSSDIEFVDEEQSFQKDESMDDFEIVFEGYSEMSSSIRKVNQAWKEAHEDADIKERSATKVSFAPDEALVEVLPADIYDRKGEWEMVAIDRLRFQRRINETEAILSPCFAKEHRSKMLLVMQVDVEQ